jgi:ATP-dependent DNA helicase RecG
MNEKELKRLLILGETETLEFKESLCEGFYKTISAFANTRGGIILLGVDNKNKIKGVDSSSKFLEELTNNIANKLSIYPDIEIINIQRRHILAFKVIHSGFLVSYKSHYYERFGNTTREINKGKLQALLSKGKTYNKKQSTKF